MNLAVEDLQGRVVKTLMEERLPAGIREIRWEPDAIRMPGVYILRLNTPSGSVITKLVITPSNH